MTTSVSKQQYNNILENGFLKVVFIRAVLFQTLVTLKNTTTTTQMIYDAHFSNAVVQALHFIIWSLG